MSGSWKAEGWGESLLNRGISSVAEGHEDVSLCSGSLAARVTSPQLCEIGVLTIIFFPTEQQHPEKIVCVLQVRLLVDCMQAKILSTLNKYFTFEHSCFLLNVFQSQLGWLCSQNPCCYPCAFFAYFFPLLPRSWLSWYFCSWLYADTMQSLLAVLLSRNLPMSEWGPTLTFIELVESSIAIWFWYGSICAA